MRSAVFWELHISTYPISHICDLHIPPKCLFVEYFTSHGVHHRMFSPVDFILKRALSPIVGKKWDLGILEPSPFSAKIRKIEERLGKFIQNIRKVGGET